MAIETSYDNYGGSGDRSQEIKVHDFSVSDNPMNIFDGNVNTVAGIKMNEKDGRFIEFSFNKTVYISDHKHLPTNLFPEVKIKYPDGDILAVTNFDISVEKKVPANSKLVVYFNHIGSNNNRMIRELQFKTSLIPNKILIKKENQYGYYTDSFQSLGTTYPTKEQFEEYGMEDLSILEPGDKQFDYEMELINQTEEGKCFSYSFDLNGQHKNMKSIDGIITE